MAALKTSGQDFSDLYRRCPGPRQDLAKWSEEPPEAGVWGLDPLGDTRIGVSFRGQNIMKQYETSGLSMVLPPAYRFLTLHAINKPRFINKTPWRCQLLGFVIFLYLIFN